MPKKVLFITSSRIGDAVLSSGVLARMVDRDIRAHFTIACGPVVSELFHDVPRLLSILPMVKRPFGGHWLRLWLDTVGSRWDRIVDLRSSRITWFLRARRKYVLAKSDDHRVIAASKVLGLMEPVPPKIFISDVRRKSAREDLGEGPFLAVGPSANWIGKQWPVERFGQLLDRLIGSDSIFANHKILILGSSRERSIVKPLLAALPSDRLIDRVGGTNLLTVCGFLEACDFYIGNDSGLMHMAAAAGVPTLGLFGPTDEKKYAPWGEACAVVRGPRSYSEITTADRYDWRKPDSYMLDLTVDKAEQAVHELWDRVGPRGTPFSAEVVRLPSRS